MSLLTQVKGLIFLFHKSSRPSSIKPLTACLYKPFKRYSKESKEHGRHGVEERAPSTAKEFERVAEEKLRAAKQGTASQTSDKLYDGAEETTTGESKVVDSIKKRFEENEAGADYRRRGNDE